MVAPVRPLFGASTAVTIKKIRERMFWTTPQLWVDDYTCWTVDRPTGWSDGTSIEAKAMVGEGRGKLRANGAGGPQSGDNVIHIESPYRFRTWADAPIETGHLLVVNEERLFRVDITKPGDADKLHMDVYLTELFLTPMPGVTP